MTVQKTDTGLLSRVSPDGDGGAKASEGALQLRMPMRVDLLILDQPKTQRKSLTKIPRQYN